jgi:hypothetical protein
LKYGSISRAEMSFCGQNPPVLSNVITRDSGPDDSLKVSQRLATVDAHEQTRPADLATGKPARADTVDEAASA